MIVRACQRRAGAGRSRAELLGRGAPRLAPSLGALAVALALVCGCGSRRSPQRVELVVFAASSLTEAFEALEQGFEQAHPGVDVQLGFAGSQVLRVQIEQGAAVDVFASASEAHMQALAELGLVGAPQTLATNELVVIVPPANPAQIEGFEQLDQAERIVIGTAAVPIGVYTRAVLDKAAAQLGAPFVAAVRERIVSEESSVRLVRAKVALGEADAAIVYRTDAGAEGVRVVEIPPALNVRARYPIASLAATRHPKEAAAFLDYVASPAGRGLLAEHGFAAAPASAPKEAG